MNEKIKALLKTIPGPAQKVLFIFIIVLIVAIYYEGPKLFPFLRYDTPKIENTVGTFYNVDHVIDGDTIAIEMPDGVEKVRLIGINTPETVNPNMPAQCFGKEATKKMSDLVSGKIIRLEYDDTQGIRDTYYRLLAYVYLEDGQMVNRKMISEGFAYEYTYIVPYKYQKEFRDLQTLAKENNRGLWSPDTCSGKK